MLSCIYIGLVIKVIADALSADSKFKMTWWYWVLFSAILISSFITGPYYAIDFGYGAIWRYCHSPEYQAKQQRKAEQARRDREEKQSRKDEEKYRKEQAKALKARQKK